jgi:sugar phosphate isomerase/epimerase
MPHYPISLQMYTVRDFTKTDLLGSLKKVAGFGYVGIEFGGMYNYAPKDFKKVLDDHGLIVSSIFSGCATEQTIKTIAENCHLFNVQWQVGGFGGDGFSSEEKCLKSAAIFQKSAELLKKEGLGFAFHNHDWEFASKYNGKTAWQIAMENAPDACSELDTYWAAVGGENPTEIIKQYSSRIPLLHIKDGPVDKKLSMTAIGEGKLDWKSIINSADPKICKWLIVELDRCDTDMFGAVDKSIKYLVNQKLGVGK